MSFEEAIQAAAAEIANNYIGGYFGNPEEILRRHFAAWVEKPEKGDEPSWDDRCRADNRRFRRQMCELYGLPQTAGWHAIIGHLTGSKSGSIPSTVQ